jgi:hypothetical protein
VCDTVCQTTWDATKNAQYGRKATPGIKRISPGKWMYLSHVALWKELVAADDLNNSNPTDHVD